MAVAAVGRAEQAEEGEVKEVIELQPFIVNLADKNEARYLRMTISLGIGESAEETFAVSVVAEDF